MSYLSHFLTNAELARLNDELRNMGYQPVAEADYAANIRDSFPPAEQSDADVALRCALNVPDDEGFPIGAAR